MWLYKRADHRGNYNILTKGSTLSALTLDYLANSSPIETAWYTDIKDAIDSAYTKGVTDGKTGSENRTVEVTYTVSHTHGSYCYPVATYSTSSWKKDKDINGWRTVTYVNVSCNVCGASWTDDNNGNGSVGSDTVRARVLTKYYGHLVDGKCPSGGVSCGVDEGERTITDTSALKAGDSVISATIMY